MDLKVVCQKKEANEENALGPFIHCRGKTPGTNRLIGITVVSQDPGSSSLSANIRCLSKRCFGEWFDVFWCECLRIAGR